MGEDEPIVMKVFYSYASEDQALRDKLEKHLENLGRQGILTSWSNRNINAGEDWEQKIIANLDEADIILLLISSDFFSSAHCYDVELPKALEKQRSGQAEVLPILLRPVDWEESPFSHLPVHPANGMAINTWPNLDAALLEAVKGIKQVVKKRAGQKYLQRANELLLKQEPEKALISCEKAIQIDPTASAAFFLKGDILFDYLKHYGKSLIAFRQGSTLEPTNVLYLIKRGDILSDKSYEIKIEDEPLSSYWRYRETIDVYQQASKLEPTNISYLIKTGDSFLACYQYEEALVAYRRASELEPANGAHYAKIGNVLATTGRRFEEAVVAYRRASELEPANASYHVKRGEVLRNRLERPEEALAAYRQASQIEPTNTAHYYEIAVTLSDLLNRHEEAIAVYRQASELEPTEAWYHDKIGDIFAKDLHRYEEALAAYQQASKLDPTKALYLAEIGEVLLNHLKRPQEAIEAYLKAAELNDPHKADYCQKDHNFAILTHKIATCFVDCT